MNPSRKAYGTITGTIFFGAALLHLVRLFAPFPITIGSWSVPHALSFLGLPVAAGLSLWGYRLAWKG